MLVHYIATISLYHMDNLYFNKRQKCVLSVFRTSLRQVNLLGVFRAPEGVRSWRKIYSGSGKMFLLRVIAGLRYRHH
jgi:hypothetical protein